MNATEYAKQYIAKKEKEADELIAKASREIPHSMKRWQYSDEATECQFAAMRMNDLLFWFMEADKKEVECFILANTSTNDVDHSNYTEEMNTWKERKEMLSNKIFKME